MANKILTGATYHDEIRGKLGVGDDVVSDADIDARTVVDIAEDRVITNVPNYASLTGTSATYVYAAAVCMVAAILAPSLTARIKKAKKDFDFSFENQAVDWAKRSIELVDEAFACIAQIEPESASSPPVFGVAGPTRARHAIERRGR